MFDFHASSDFFCSNARFSPNLFPRSTGTLAGAVEVLVKLIWDEVNPPFLPHVAVLQTIVWTFVCALDGVMWAGITWSPLSRVQALSKLSAVDDLKVISPSTVKSKKVFAHVK